MRLFGVITGYRVSSIPGKGDELRQEMESDFDLVSDWGQLLRFIRSQSRGEWNTRDLQNWLSAEVFRLARNVDNYKKTEDLSDLDISWNEGEIDKITNQLLALGLIVRRSYPEWAFTQKGLLQASRQMGIKKGELRSGSGDWCKIEIGTGEWNAGRIVDVEDW